MDKLTAIEQLIELYGNASQAAHALLVDRQLIEIWVRQGYIPFLRGQFIEDKTEGKIKAVKVWEDASKARHHGKN